MGGKSKVLECALFYLLLRSMNFGKKGKESCGSRAAQEIAARERPEKKAEKAGFTSGKTLERQKVTAAVSAKKNIFFSLPNVAMQSPVFRVWF